MTKVKVNLIKIIPFILPIILGIIQIIQSIIDTPAFYTRIDPEYLCLLNGLNVSLLKFDNIGYVDLPGTPFILITGIFIRIIHLFLGKDQLYIDVITRPEFYLQSCSFMLMLFTTIVLIWGGKKILRDKNDIVAVIILQSTFLLSEVCLHLPTRYMADRILPLYVFILAIFIIRFFRKDCSETKTAILLGIFMGIGIITKLNFFPVIIIGALIIKSFRNKLIFLGSLLISSFISFLPVISKFDYVKKFVLSMVTHDGIYGSGEERIINFANLQKNVQIILNQNLSFTILIVLTVVTILFLLFRKKRNEYHLIFLVSFLLATSIAFIMVSKQFKDYYLAPLLALSGLVLFVIWNVTNEHIKVNQYFKLFLVYSLLIFLIYPSFKVARHSKNTIKRINERQQTVDFLNSFRKSSDWYFVEPSWKSGPAVENGLMWGISYVAGRNEYRKFYEQVYPRVIAFEGIDRQISQFRCGDANEKEIINSRSNILLFSIHGDQTEKRKEKLINLAAQYSCEVTFDTVFVNRFNRDVIINANINAMSTEYNPVIN